MVIRERYKQNYVVVMSTLSIVRNMCCFKKPAFLYLCSVFGDKVPQGLQGFGGVTGWSYAGINVRG